VFLQEFSVVVNKISYGVLSQYIIADLCLHEAKLFGNVFLQQMEKFVIAKNSYTKLQVIFLAGVSDLPTAPPRCILALVSLRLRSRRTYVERL